MNAQTLFEKLWQRHVVLEDPGGLVGLRRTSAPDATVKLGNLYLKAASLSGSVLHSDNINWEANNPQSGTIGIVRSPSDFFISP